MEKGPMNQPKYSFEEIWDTQENPPYIWITILQSDIVLARVKLIEEGDSCIIKFLTVEFHWRKKGVGRFIIQRFKQKYRRITASRVKFDAHIFWEKLDFKQVKESHDYLWEDKTPLKRK